MSKFAVCPECGTIWLEGKTCQDHFYQMLFWEAEQPELGEVHHLMVLCYHLQHPSLYAPEGLTYARQLLADFVERGLSTSEVRARAAPQVDSGKRQWKIKAKPGLSGAYPSPVEWKMTAADVIAGDMENYCENVRAWANSVYETLKSID